MNKKQEKIVWDAVMEEVAVFSIDEWLNPRIGLGQTKHAKKRINSTVCCPSCFTPVRVKPSIKACPECGCILDGSIMETLRDNAFELSTFAWDYRNQYEKDVRKDESYKGKVTIHHHLLPPTDWLIYLASIVFVAIVGGLSYDAFKRILSKIAKSFRKRFKRELPEEQWLQDFHNKLEEYFRGRRESNSPIFRAYVQSLLRSAEFFAMVKSSPKYEENLMKVLKKAKNKAKNTDENDSAEISAPLLETKNVPKELIEEQLAESIERMRKEELRIKRLRDYLRKIMNTEESNNDDANQT
jgi:hypothetical protein